MIYDTLGIHRAMLRDDPRNEAYRRALLARVRATDAVLDVGAGTGLLSMFAAQAGARRVYAVERTSIAHLARRLVALNNFADRVHVIEADVESVMLPEPVDVIVSEWLGTIGIDENLLSAVVTARDRWLKPGGRLLPERVTAMLAPAHAPALGDEFDFWRARPYGLNLSPIAAGAAQEYTWTGATDVNGNGSGGDATLLAPAQPMWTTDVYRVSLAESRLPARASLRFRASADGSCNALAAWFVADFGEGITLSTAPDAPATHWRQCLYPLERSVEVERGTEIAVEIACLPLVPGYSHHAWSVRIDGRAWEHHDTRRVTWFE